ncbi:MAG: tetratricopeptide (TPR) repeat protein [Halioglobus sp.]|jgi:tetratricopeptide (TPR) repeat protein
MTVQNAARFQRLLQQLAQSVQKKDPSAIGKILSLLAKTPKEPNLLHLAALAYLGNGEYKRAIEYFERSLQSHSKQPELHNNLGNAHKSAEDFTKAEKHYRTALAMQPEFLDALRNLGLLLIKLERYAEADQTLQQARKLAPEDVVVLTSLGNMCREQELFINAVDYYQQALSINPNYVNALHNLGLCYKYLEQAETAIDYYMRAQALAPQLAEIDLNYGNALFELARYEEAETQYQSAVKKAPLLISAHETLSELYWQLGQRHKIDESYLRAMKTAPDHPGLRLSLIRLLIAAGDFDSAKTLAGESLERCPGPELYQAQGKLFANELDYPRARDSLQKSLSLAYSLDTAQDLSKIHILEGNYDQAEQLLSVAQQREPDDQLSWALKGLCWRLSDDLRYQWLIDYEKYIQVYVLPAPSGYSSLEVFLEELEAVLLSMHSTKFAPSQQTLKHGTQTPGRLLHKKNPVIALYKTLLEDAVHEYIDHLPEDDEHPLLRRKSHDFMFAGSWSVKLGSGGFHVNHVHPQGWISSACYISMPKQSRAMEGLDAGIKFGESGLGLGEREITERFIHPRAGQLVLFPSYTWHGTYSFECDPKDYRLTAPFDVIPN